MRPGGTHHWSAGTKENDRLQIIGVLDVRHGRAVHARAGARDRYAPVESAAGRSIEAGDARTLAEVYTGVLGISAIYAADLDAIIEQRPQDGVTRDLASLGAPLWLDAGVRSVDDARRAIDLGAHQVIVGLETLPSFDVLSSICAAVGRDRVSFSLDLRNGEPMAASPRCLDGERSPEDIARLAVATGARTLIVLDLARVGTGHGVDIDLLRRIHSAEPATHLVAGGGVREWNDLVDLARAGCHAALVATALHDGTISAEQIAKAATLNL